MKINYKKYFFTLILVSISLFLVFYCLSDVIKMEDIDGTGTKTVKIEIKDQLKIFIPSLKAKIVAKNRRDWSYLGFWT